MPQSEHGKTDIWDDFLGPDNDLTWGTGTVRVGDWGFVSVAEGSFEWTVDEPGGVVAITTDTGTSDNAVLFGGTFTAANGALVTEWRFKFSSLTCAIYCGWAETLNLATPVMPAEFSSSTMTYNGGATLGFNYDVDGTDDDFRAVGADGSAVLSGADANGTRANETITVDEWYIIRVVVNPDGSAKCLIGHDGGIDGEFQLVKEISAGITVTDQLYAMLMIENRGGGAVVLEVDYGYASGNRDWTV